MPPSPFYHTHHLHPIQSKERFRLLLRHDGWGRQLSKAVRPITQWEIPAYAGMTWEDVGMTRPGGNLGVRIRGVFIETPVTLWSERNRLRDSG